MLLSLHIKDFAIIDELEVEFAPGLNIMTGETGAGKTIIVEALNLVLGARAQTDLIRAGSDRANITAIFDMASLPSSIKPDLKNLGIEINDELIVHRIVGNGGRSRISINGVPVTGSILRKIGERLVDVSSQHEHQLLLDNTQHVSILDIYGGDLSILDEYVSIHRKYSELKSEIHSLKESEAKAKEQLDFIKFQLDEITAASLKPGEDVEIESAKSRLKHSVDLEEKSRSVESILYRDSGSAVEIIDAAITTLGECRRFDESVSKWADSLERARSEIEDVARELSIYADGLDSDPATLEEMEDRFHLIKRIIKKHGGSIEECLAKSEKMKSEIEKIESYDDILNDKNSELEKIIISRRKVASALSRQRKKSAQVMGNDVARNLFDLGMGKTSFSVKVEEVPEDGWDETGPVRVEFLLAPNVGEPFMPLVKIASGGELSRVILAIKEAMVGKTMLTATSIFDEVDSGIGGSIAEIVGRKLKGVAKLRQVICITHLPQVAVFGDSHIKISKSIRKGRTVTMLLKLPEDKRVDEVARMLGGTKITEATVSHANEMLCRARDI